MPICLLFFLLRVLLDNPLTILKIPESQAIGLESHVFLVIAMFHCGQWKEVDKLNVQAFVSPPQKQLSLDGFIVTVPGVDLFFKIRIFDLFLCNWCLLNSIKTPYRNFQQSCLQ